MANLANSKKENTQNQVPEIFKKISTYIDNEKVIKISTALKTSALVIMLFVVFYSPYLRGLYFEKEILTAEILIFSAFILFWLGKIIIWDKRFLKTPADYGALVLTLVYLISIFGAVEKRAAIMECLKYCTCFSVFLMISELAAKYETRKKIMWVITAQGAGLCILGLDAAAGGHIAEVFNKLFAQLGSSIRFTGLIQWNRIASTFQYQNAFAGYLIGIFFITTGLITVSSGLKQKLLAGAASFLVLITFINTLSRGAFLIMPVAVLVYILVFPGKDRIKGFVYMLAPVLPAMLVSVKMPSYVANPGQGGKLWLMVILGAAGTVAITLVLGLFINYLEKVDWKVYAGIAGFGIVVVIIGAIVAFTASKPLVLSNFDGEKNKSSNTSKSVILKPEKTYKFKYRVNAEMKEDKPHAYSVGIYNRTEKNVVFDEAGDRIASFNEKATDDTVSREVEFTLPQDTEAVSIRLNNTYPGTKAVFTDGRIIDAETGETVKKLVLSYRFLPEVISTRMKDVQANKSGLLREIYYRDGYKIFKDYMLIGAGGGAWPFIYQSYQSHYYSTKQAHNYVLQVAVESGIIGLAALMFLILAIGVMFTSAYFNRKNKGIRNKDSPNSPNKNTPNNQNNNIPNNQNKNSQSNILRAVFITSMAGIFMHSLVDFDLSLMSIQLLLWVIMGLFNAEFKAEPKNAESQKAGPENTQHKNAEPNTEANKAKEAKNAFPLFTLFKLAAPKRLKIYPVIGLILSLAIIFVPARFVKAINYGEKSVEAHENNKKYKALQFMAKASQTDGFRAQYKIDWANLVKAKDNIFPQDIMFADNLMDEAEDLTKYNSELKAEIGRYHLERGNIEKGLELFDKAADLRPLRPEEWQQRAGAYFSVVLAYFRAEKMEKAMEYIDKTLMLIKEARSINAENMNPFIFNVETCEILERLKYVKDSIGKQNKFELDKISYYNIPHMDIDGDNIPDQWNQNVPEGVRINCDNDNLVLENKTDTHLFIESRNLELNPGRTYTLKINLADSDNENDMLFRFSGLQNNAFKLARNGNTLKEEIKVPEDFNKRDNTLQLGVKGKLNIQNISVLEE